MLNLNCESPLTRHSRPHSSQAWGWVRDVHLPTQRESPKLRHSKHDINMKCGKRVPCEQLHIRFPASLSGNVIRGIIQLRRLEKGLRKRLKNVTNHESYFCEKREKCHQKGSVDNPIGLKITALLAEQPGDRPRARDVMQRAAGAQAERGGWGMRKLA